MRSSNVRSLRRAVGALSIVVLLAVATVTPAMAAAGLRTAWPVVEVEPGSEVTVTLEVTASPSQRVDLEVVEAPDGWGTLLRGGGFVVHAVTAGPPDDPAEVSLEVVVPPDATEGRHRLEVLARAEDGSQERLVVDLVVVEQVVGAVTLQAEFPELSGAADDTFEWSLDLASVLPGETTFALQAEGPPGWRVTARPRGEQQATTVTLAGGDDRTIEVEADPPADVQAGSYEVTVVVSGGGERLELPLTAVVEGIVSMELSTEDGRLNASGSTGQATRIPLQVTNTGSAVLEGIEVESDPPAGWEVAFEPQELAPLGPGESAELVALVTPSREAIAGDYMVGLSVSADGRGDEVEIRFQVRTPMAWGAVGIGIVGLALAGLGVVFRRFGRR